MAMLDIITNKNELLNYRMHASFLAVFTALLTVLIIKRKSDFLKYPPELATRNRPGNLEK